LIVIAGLDPAIHASPPGSVFSWTAVSSTAMTIEGCFPVDARGQIPPASWPATVIFSSTGQPWARPGHDEVVVKIDEESGEPGFFDPAPTEAGRQASSR